MGTTLFQNIFCCIHNSPHDLSQYFNVIYIIPVILAPLIINARVVFNLTFAAIAYYEELRFSLITPSLYELMINSPRAVGIEIP